MNIKTNYYNKQTKHYMTLKYKVLPSIKVYSTITLLIALHAIASTITN